MRNDASRRTSAIHGGEYVRKLAIPLLIFAILTLGCTFFQSKPDTQISCFISQPSSHQANFKIVLTNNNIPQTTPSVAFESPDSTIISINPGSATLGIIGAGETRELTVLVVARASALKGNYAISAHISNFGSSNNCTAYMTIT